MQVVLRRVLRKRRAHGHLSSGRQSGQCHHGRFRLLGPLLCRISRARAFFCENNGHSYLESNDINDNNNDKVTLGVTIPELTALLPH